MSKLLRLAVTSAFAAAVAAPALAAPETFAIDNSHTYPRFEYNHFGYSTQQSRFNKTTGTITLDRAAKTGSVDVTIDTTSVDTGFPLFNEHIQGEDFFHTEKYPTITFKSTGVKFDGDKLAAVDGNLTIKGVTHPLTFPAKIKVAKDSVTADAKNVAVDRTLYGMKYGSGKFFQGLGDKMINDQFWLDLSVTAKK